MEITLNSSDIFLRTYSCNVEGLQVSIDRMKIRGYEGQHVYLYQSIDVNDVIIMKQTAKFLPKGIGALFVYLRQFEVILSKLESIEKNDFIQMIYLQDLRLDQNEIEVIPHDAFWLLKNLRWLSLSGNKIQLLNDRLTLKLLKLMWITVDDNFIEFLDSRALQVNKNLELLSIRNNKLIQVNFNFNHFNSLAFVDFSMNFCVNTVARKAEKGFAMIQKEITENCA